MKCPVKSAAKIRLRNLTCQLNELGIGEMLLQFGKQFVADLRRSARHGHGKIEHEFLNRTKNAAVPVVREVSQLLLGNTFCSALGRA
jgi:hypothetical protein